MNVFMSMYVCMYVSGAPSDLQYCLAIIITKDGTCAGNRLGLFQVGLSFLQPLLKKVVTFVKTYQVIFT